MFFKFMQRLFLWEKCYLGLQEYWLIEIPGGRFYASRFHAMLPQEGTPETMAPDTLLLPQHRKIVIRTNENELIAEVRGTVAQFLSGGLLFLGEVKRANGAIYIAGRYEPVAALTPFIMLWAFLITVFVIVTLVLFLLKLVTYPGEWMGEATLLQTFMIPVFGIATFLFGGVVGRAMGLVARKDRARLKRYLSNLRQT